MDFPLRLGPAGGLEDMNELPEWSRPPVCQDVGPCFMLGVAAVDVIPCGKNFPCGFVLGKSTSGPVTTTAPTGGGNIHLPSDENPLFLASGKHFLDSITSEKPLFAPVTIVLDVGLIMFLVYLSCPFFSSATPSFEECCCFSAPPVGNSFFSSASGLIFKGLNRERLSEESLTGEREPGRPNLNSVSLRFRLFSSPSWEETTELSMDDETSDKPM
eukprot:Gb_36671 [translate_table: standard]